MDKIGLLQLGEYASWDEDNLSQHFTLHRYFAAENKAEFLATYAADIRCIGSRGDLAVPKDIIDALPNLEIIAVNGVGYDGVDLAAAKARGIPVTNTPGVLTGDVADLAVAMALMQTRRMGPADAYARGGAWATQGGFPLQARMQGRRAGILGLGRIGRAVARRLAAFDMEIAYAAQSAKTETAGWVFIQDPIELAKWCDFLFVTLAATPATRHIVNADVLRALGTDGMVINVSRAANIDENALLHALEKNIIAGAARFAPLDNVLLQPHHGSATVDTRKAMGQMVLDNLLAHFNNQPLITPVV